MKEGLDTLTASLKENKDEGLALKIIFFGTVAGHVDRPKKF